jgi:xanthine/uracil permease
MQIAHSFLAILAGFIAILGLTGIATALLKRFAPGVAREDGPADPFVMAVHVGLNLVFSGLGGYITARFAQKNPIAHTLMLALVVLLLTAFSTLQMKGKRPIYYLLISITIPPLAVLAGGLLRLHQVGVLHW